MIIVCFFAFGCKKQTYKAYDSTYKLSSKGGYYGKSGPYKLYSKNEQFYIESIPFEHVNVILGDLCSGITKVWSTKNDSLLYTINRYFGLDNTFFSSNGKSIAYVNNFWRGTSYDSCSTNILEIYQEGKLKTEYSYHELLKQESNEESSWLFWDSKSNSVLAKNDKYSIGDTIYLIPDKTGTVLEIDLMEAKVLTEIDTADYLNNLERIEYVPPKVEFISIEEKENLPNLINGIPLRKGLKEKLNVELISTDAIEKVGRYYFRFWIECKIDNSGNPSDIKVSSNEHVLTEISNELRKKIKSYVATQSFKIDTLPYNLDYWQFEDRFYISRNPLSLSNQDLENYRVQVCEIDSLSGRYIPTDVEDAHKELEKILSDTVKVQLKNGEPSHFGLGMWMRNNWGLWAGGRLKCYFAERELYHPDHISSFIISTYEIKLNDKSVNIDSLIQEYSEAEKEWMKN